MTPRVLDAVAQARKLRRDLVRECGNVELGGECAQAAVRLALAIADPASFVVGIFAEHFAVGGQCDHCWNEIDGYIVDVTATQFFRSYRAVQAIRAHQQRGTSRRYIPRVRGARAINVVKHWEYPNWKQYVRSFRELARIHAKTPPERRLAHG